jgi:predicted TIM-barrel fold metal-dependent hydrolase
VSPVWALSLREQSRCKRRPQQPLPPPHLPVRQDWLDRRHEEIIEPELPIVDPHHHLVDRPETGLYLLPELLADTGSGHNITATVYLEWLSMYRGTGSTELRPVGEIEFANGVAAMAASGTYGKTQVCAGIVGYADLALGAAVEKVLEAMIEAGGGRFRDIRFITASHPDQAAWGSLIIRPAGLLLDPRVREGFARLAPLGLSFDSWMSHTQLGEQVDLARAFPQTPIVLDHVGGAVGLGPYAGKRDRLEREDPRARHLPQRPYQARRAWHADVRVHPSSRRIAAIKANCRGRRRPLSRHPFYHRLAPRPGGLGFADHSPRRPTVGPESARGLRSAGAARSQL